MCATSYLVVSAFWCVVPLLLLLMVAQGLFNCTNIPDVGRIYELMDNTNDRLANVNFSM